MAKETNAKSKAKKEVKSTIKEPIKKNISKTESAKKKTNTQKKVNVSKKEIAKPVKKEELIITQSKKQTSFFRHEKIGNGKMGHTDEITKLVEVILALLVVFAAFYLITYYVTKSKNSDQIKNPEQNKTDNSIIQYDEILLGNLLDQKNDTYYVLVMSRDEINNKTFSMEIQNYKSKEGNVRLYTANLNEIFNKSYKSDSSKLDSENIDDLKVKTTTLIKISNHKIVESVEETGNVKNKLSELAK